MLLALSGPPKGRNSSANLKLAPFGTDCENDREGMRISLATMPGYGLGEKAAGGPRTQRKGVFPDSLGAPDQWE